MSSNADKLDPTGAIRARLLRNSTRPQKPGTLSKWADEQDNEYWEFVGDGQVTSTEFVERVIERESENDESPMKSLVGNRPFAEHAATTLLGESNPNAPIPQGQVKELGLKQLLQLVTPFIESYAKQYKAAGNGQGSAPDDHNRITGNVQSHGLTLPID